MRAGYPLFVFLVLKLVQHLVERYLARLNRNYYQDETRRRHVQKLLEIDDADMAKTYAYSEDRFRFSQVVSWLNFILVYTLLAFGILGVFEDFARIEGRPILSGLLFFGCIALTTQVLAIPLDYLRVFRLEEKHGFNRQTRAGFFLDRAKGLLIAVVLGGGILALILWITEYTGNLWWLYAWLAMSGFSIITAWAYPTFLAPLFNKFSPVEGDLSKKINALAEKIGFKTAGIFVMDASKRSSHGNAYFTGVLGKKRIVLFDTLVESMSADEVVAVLAHELGHFKLKHVFWSLIRGTPTTGVIFYLLSLALPLDVFYRAFHLSGVSNYGALLVFSMWFGLVDFIMQPLENYLSRRSEFAADRFAQNHLDKPRLLGDALLKLREKSHAMPLTHPFFSKMYHSHPPIVERLDAMKYARANP